MRILCISHEFPPVGGGGATACQAITLHYAARGHAVTVLTCAYGALAAESEQDGVRVLRVPCKRAHRDHCSFSEMLDFLLAANKRLPSLMKEATFDCVHDFFGIPSGPLAWYLKRRYQLPYIVRLGGGDIPGTQARFAAVYRLIGPLLKKIWSEAAYVVANSSGLELRARAFSQKARFAVIPNGIEPPPEAAPREPRAAFRVVSVTRILRRKGLHHMVAALPALLAAAGREITYTVIGDGPERAELEALAQRLNVADRVTITGMLPRAEVLARLPDFDVFVLPSEWEGMPNVVLEAMSRGLPIVMTSCEGSAELIDGNGTVIPLEGDIPTLLTEALLAMRRDPAALAAMGARSRALAAERFQWAATADAYLALFESALKEASALTPPAKQRA